MKAEAKKCTKRGCANRGTFEGDTCPGSSEDTSDSEGSHHCFICMELWWSDKGKHCEVCEEYYCPTVWQHSFVELTKCKDTACRKAYREVTELWKDDEFMYMCMYCFEDQFTNPCKTCYDVPKLREAFDKVIDIEHRRGSDEKKPTTPSIPKETSEESSEKNSE